MQCNLVTWIREEAARVGALLVDEIPLLKVVPVDRWDSDAELRALVAAFKEVVLVFQKPISRVR